MALRKRLRQWWLARLPACDSWTLTQRNIYILPTRAGFVFALVLVLMLLASINYQLNLGYALSFLLAGAGLVSMHLTHGTLRGLTLHLRPVPAVFAGDAALLEVVLTNRGGERHGVGLHFEDRGRHGPSFVWTDIPAQGQASAHVSIVPPRRGLHPVPVLVVQTLFPFGLFRAWTWLHLPLQRIVYPAARGERPLPQARGDKRRATGDGQETGDDEWRGLRDYRDGDSPRRIAWKAYARGAPLLVGDYAAEGGDLHAFDFERLALLDLEARLEQLCRWIVDAEQRGEPYSLRLPSGSMAAGRGSAHRHRCLTALARVRP